MHLSRQLNCRSLRCSWSIACRGCSNYIFILDLTPGFKGLGIDDFKTRWESFRFWDLLRLISETLRYLQALYEIPGHQLYIVVYLCNIISREYRWPAAGVIRHICTNTDNAVMSSYYLPRLCAHCGGGGLWSAYQGEMSKAMSGSVLGYNWQEVGIRINIRCHSQASIYDIQYIQ